MDSPIYPSFALLDGWTQIINFGWTVQIINNLFHETLKLFRINVKMLNGKPAKMGNSCQKDHQIF